MSNVSRMWKPKALPRYQTLNYVQMRTRHTFSSPTSFASPRVPDFYRKDAGTQAADPRCRTAEDKDSGTPPREDVSFRTVCIVLSACLKSSTMSRYCTIFYFKKALKLIFIVLKTKLKITI